MLLLGSLWSEAWLDFSAALWVLFGGFTWSSVTLLFKQTRLLPGGVPLEVGSCLFVKLQLLFLKWAFFTSLTQKSFLSPWRPKPRWKRLQELFGAVRPDPKLQKPFPSAASSS